MDSSQIQFARISFPEQKKSNNIGNLINMCLYRWPLFLLCIALSLGAAYFFLSIQQPIHQIKATLLIQDVMKAPNAQSALHEIDLTRSPKIIENEIEVLKSKQMIGQVIKDLNLTISYFKKDHLKYQDLYNSGPVKLLGSYKTYGEAQHIIIDIINDKSFNLEGTDGSIKTLYFDQRFNIGKSQYTLTANEKIKEYTGSKIRISLLNNDALTHHYQSVIQVEPLNKLSTGILLSIDDVVPMRGKDILNRLISNYQLANNSEQSKSLSTTLLFLEQRIASLHGELTDAELGISSFKSSRGLTDLSEDSKVSLQNMQSNDRQLNDVNVQLSIVDGVQKYMNTASSSEKMPVTLGITDPALNNLIDRLSQLQMQRERLLATTPETNPDFIPIDRQIIVTRNLIKENIGNIRATLFNTRQKLLSYNSKYESSIKKIPVQEQQFVNIKRQQAIKENLYTYLLQKKEEVSMNYASTLSKSQIIDSAYAEPVQKARAIIVYALAVLMGLVVPGAFVHARSSFSTKVTELQDLKSVLDAPVISEIAQSASSNPIVVGRTDSNETSEQFRALRTKLSYYYGGKKNGRVTLVTSSSPGEGKSFISCNLAISLAAIGRKTLLLELDLRKPKVARAFGLPDGHLGVTDLLTGQADLSETLQTTDFSSDLQIISSGAFIPNPSDLLENALVKDFIDDLRNRFDDIIIDSPPVHLVPDALILSPLADLTLYTIRQGHTDQSELHYINDLTRQKQLVNVHMVFNGIQRLRYGYGSEYDRSYSYHSSSQPSRVHNALFRNFTSRF
ncbi:polysaccharide biosynthesis tyrosine autokinase [Dyadobacter sp. CY323]|uniref:GumC family protein n=1 Tax=Dyadobacter sp. CY323 TaxID=2907302 RepID=UPI001F1ADB44|nr:polysaccharide biosynthesis tyrosine autokinase [Dyadobacter sp. CY323]MCE6991381.1 polysaccharide biosynthesis tyrosine autokinase [Dyadobacter sp. CY323]